MVALTRVLGALIRWVTATPRRVVSTLVVGLLVTVVFFGPDPHPGAGAQPADQRRPPPSGAPASP